MATEFDGCDFGDKRLEKRVKRLAEALAEDPGGSIGEATGEWGQALGAYRFLGNERVEPGRVIAAHRGRTLERAQGEAVVLAINDTTSFNYSEREGTTGLGPISSYATKGYGIWMHSLLGVNLAGMPLGVLEGRFWVRDPAEFGGRHQRNRKPLEQKESYRWLQSYEALERCAAETPTTRWVMVADREADIYELWEKGSRAGAPGLLVRMQHDRGLRRGRRRLFSHLEHLPVAGSLTMEVPRKSGQRARMATLEVRFAAVEIAAPWLKSEQPPLALWAIEARESHPPRGVAPLHWRLLTNLPVFTAAEALEKLRWYSLRWTIEVFHRVLKSDCAAEGPQLQTGVRLQRLLAIKLVVAWRIMALTQLGRQQPALSASVVLEEAEWQVLYLATQKEDVLPKQPPQVGEAMRWVAQLGGFLGRRSDGDPGPTTLARGIEKLQSMVLGWKLARRAQRCV